MRGGTISHVGGVPVVKEEVIEINSQKKAYSKWFRTVNSFIVEKKI